MENNSPGINRQTFKIILNKEIKSTEIFNQEKSEMVKETAQKHIRRQELLSMGFKELKGAEAYRLEKYYETWYVDFWKITDYDDNKWNILIEDIKHDVTSVRNDYFEHLKQSEGYIFSQKRITDKLNKYKSNLAEEKAEKINKRLNTEKIKELEIRIETLKELL